MSHIVPMVSSSPPPMDDTTEDDEDDEFGDFTVADDTDAPTTPVKLNSPYWERPDENATDEYKEDKEGTKMVPTSQDNTNEELSTSVLCSEHVFSSSVEGSSLLPMAPHKEEFSETLVMSVVTEEDISPTDELNNFSDLQSANEMSIDCESETNKHLPQEIDEFGDFESVPATQDINSDDDFEDFESSVISCSVPLGHSDLVHRLQSVVTSLFPSSSAATVIDVNVPVLDERLAELWFKLKDVESSHALLFQWSGSAASKNLLMALEIDSRNILFGAQWNASVPRFAANLGFSPLEPVRASRSSPTTSFVPVPTTSTAITDQEVLVPAAQFDWNGSGLVNPLDCLEMSSSDTAVQEILTMPKQEMSTGNELVQQILATTQTIPVHCSRDGLSAEAIQVLDKLPELSFMQAKLLMFPVLETSP